MEEKRGGRDRRLPDPDGDKFSVGPKTTITLATMLTIIPLVVWAAQTHEKVTQLEKTNLRIESELEKVNRKLDEIIRTMPRP